MKFKTIILILIIIGIVSISINFSIDKKDLAGKFTSTEIRQIKIGMSLEEVQQTIGAPYKITSLAGLHELNCKGQNERLICDINPGSDIRQIINTRFTQTDYCCDGNKEDLSHKRVTLVYTKRVEFSRHYPMLWVHLDSSFKVNNVFAKQYDGYLGINDPCIYSLEADGIFEKQRLFEKNFN